MKSSHITSIVMVLLTGGFTALWFTLRDDSLATVRVDAETESVARATGAAETSDSDLSETPSTSVAREQLAPPAETSDAEADVGPADIVRGRLRDKTTGEALPEFLLDFNTAGGHHELVTTDAQGEFGTQGRLALGTLAVSFPDRRGRIYLPDPQNFEHRSADAILDLSVESGPTFWLDPQPAHDLDVANLDARLWCIAGDGRAPTELEPVRMGEGTWVRFGPVDGTSSDSLEVMSRDGLWRGRTKVQDIHGRVPGVVLVTLAPAAALYVHVVDGHGVPIEDVNVYLDWKASSGKQSKSAGRTGSDGSYTFKYLADGEGTLAARSVFHAPQDAPIKLVLLEKSKVDLVMPRLESVGAIGGRISSETGKYTPDVALSLSPPSSATTNGKGPAPLRTAVHWQIVDGRSVGMFSFEDLPKGDYRLDLNHKDDFFYWEPPRLVLAPPSQYATILVHDAVPNAGIAFRVHDGDNGILLDGLHVSLDMRGGPARILSVNSNQVLYQHVPYERRIQWRIEKEDYQPAYGDDASFAAEEMRGNEKVRFADVNLDPGWGDEFHVAVAQGNGGPIGGAHILIDGRDAGTTDKDGTLRVFAKKKPMRVECTYGDWRVSNKIDLSPPWSRSNRNYIRIDMKPPPTK